MRGAASAMFSARLLLSTAGFVLLALTGCASTPQPTDRVVDVGADAARHALDMVGRPYRFGGSTPHGFDCSGLVQYSYARAGMRMPRTMEEQWANSRPVTGKQIRAGDLLFFHQEGKFNSHIGLYVGNGRFVHAPSTGKPVSTASLANPYWRRHFSVARRPHTD